MKGAREYARLFDTGQYGRFYLVSGIHARGRTFHIFILPENEYATGNGPNNPPLNKNAVEVYGIIDGQPGWTESYGWLREGKWQEDFYRLVEEEKSKLLQAAEIRETRENQQRIAEEERIQKLLADYK